MIVSGFIKIRLPDNLAATTERMCENMNHRSRIVTKVEETCVVCQEATIEQVFRETRHEYGLPGEDRTQVDITFYGMCEKCIEKDDAWDVFNMLTGCYFEAM
jgi:Fe2+ or Zn2+ uptake regulation protein